MPPEFISHASTAETLALGKEPFAMLADGDRTRGLLVAVEVWVQPGGGPPLHLHTREDEAFYVLEGTLGLVVEDRTFRVPAGSLAWAPRSRAHRFFNDTSTPARILVLMAPAGIDRMFRACSTPVPPGTRVAPTMSEQDMQAFMPRFVQACTAQGIDLDPKRRPSTPPTTDAFVATPATAETVSLVGDVYALLATARNTDGAVYVHEGTCPPGGGPPLHVHSREDEAFYILEGTLTFYIENKRLDATKGSFVWAPKGQRHRFANESDAPVRMLVIALPAGIERMFRACGDQLPPGSTTPSPVTPDTFTKVMAACASHDIQIIAPPPQ